MRPVSPTADNPVSAMEEEPRLNSILILGDCVSKRLSLEVVLSYAPQLVIVPGFCCKILLCVFLLTMAAWVNFITFWW